MGFTAFLHRSRAYRVGFGAIRCKDTLIFQVLLQPGKHSEPARFHFAELQGPRCARDVQYRRPLSIRLVNQAKPRIKGSCCTRASKRGHQCLR
jgi:hypothetical protein